jgi:hypothetical protein
MKKLAISVVMLLPALCWAQQGGSSEPTPSGTVATSVNFPVERVQTPTTADVYCAGFIGKPVAKDKYVMGGLESPHATRFVNGEAIYLKGQGYEAGQEYSIVRETFDANRYELFAGQWAALKAAGQPYEELGRVKIIDTRHKDAAIARVEFSCDPIVPGDFAIPFVEKPLTAFHPPMRFDRFAPSSGQVSGRVLMAKDFDSELGTGGKVYMNIGASQGLKVGDFLRAVRTYSADQHDAVDSLSFKTSYNEPTQTEQVAIDPNWMTKTGGPVVHVADMPRRAVAEIVVVGTTPSTSTGMVVFAMEPLLVGDGVELDPQ